jgi:hypothetical protein
MLVFHSCGGGGDMVFVFGLIPCVSNWSVFPLLFHSYFHLIQTTFIRLMNGSRITSGQSDRPPPIILVMKNTNTKQARVSSTHQHSMKDGW